MSTTSPGPPWQPSPPDPRFARWGEGWTPPPRMRTRRVVAFALAAVFLPLLLVGGCALLLNAFVWPSYELLVRQTPVTELEVGQCFDGAPRPTSTGETIVAFVEVIDCGEPHQAELIAAFAYPAGAEPAAYPGVNEVLGYAERQCVERFTAYVGVRLEQSELEMAPLYPTQRGWRAGDRTIQCVVYAPIGTETMTGTVREARR